MKYAAFQLIHALTTEYFAPSIGLIYILVKITLRHIIHKAIDHNYDVWGVISWFSVDITLLSLSVCTVANAPYNRGLNREESILWYLAFVFFFIIATFCYLFFVKRRDKLDKGKKSKKDKIQPYKDLRLSFYLSAGWFIGFAWFWVTLTSLKSN
jgi:H+/Cl- antiporter ClcA